ncbi:uncharacterized protein LOC126674112 [Mercurialis annua]|uniref:uncharacterized protein LOC126674112 n=1 Tax=Mercurialis annua TaxID=3986 RepID=UPI0021602D41|nr:uncharacterized protein LOC126674112 [Mercurialis annua]
MDLRSDESKTVVGSFDQETGRSLTGGMSNSDDMMRVGREIRDLDAINYGLESTKMGIREPLDGGTSGNLSYAVNEVVLERMIVINSGEIVTISGQNRKLSTKIDDLGLNGVVLDQKTCVSRINDVVVEQVGEKSRQDPSNSTNAVVLETVIIVNSEEIPSISSGNEQLGVKDGELGPSKVLIDKSKTKLSKAEEQSCVIDVKCGGGGGFKDCDGETVCRICHLSSEVMAETTATTSSMDLIELGCGCKDELGIAHAYCAEAWFKLKGNRMCEICGETAKNVTGVGENRFMEEWNQRRFIGSNSNSSERGGGCWRGQPFCNFLMACLVIAFVLPWFFRVNMF